MSVSTQRTKRRQQREETRRQILDAAQEFLRERSFRELSVDALMASTGHTRTVFYRHFEDIPTMILALIAEEGAELLDLARDWASTEEVGPGVARARLAAFVDFHVRKGPIIHAVAEAAHHDEIVEQAYNAMVENFIALTADAIQTRIDRGELETFDAPQVARALVLMLNAYLIDVMGRGVSVEPDRVLETVWTIWTRTLFPRH